MKDNILVNVIVALISDDNACSYRNGGGGCETEKDMEGNLLLLLLSSSLAGKDGRRGARGPRPPRRRRGRLAQERLGSDAAAARLSDPTTRPVSERRGVAVEDADAHALLLAGRPDACVAGAARVARRRRDRQRPVAAAVRPASRRRGARGDDAHVLLVAGLRSDAGDGAAADEEHPSWQCRRKEGGPHPPSLLLLSYNEGGWSPR